MKSLARQFWLVLEDCAGEYKRTDGNLEKQLCVNLEALSRKTIEYKVYTSFISSTYRSRFRETRLARIIVSFKY